jgi:hypothetical protein
VSSKIVQNEPFPASVAQELVRDAAELTVAKTLLAAVRVEMMIRKLLARIGSSALRVLWIMTSQRAH